MKSMNDVVNNLKIPSKIEGDHDREIKLDEKTMQVVNNLFMSMNYIFPAFKQAWTTQKDFDGAKREWTKAFMIAGLNDINKIKHGLNKYRITPNPFVPSPGQFIEMCHQECDAPSVTEAYEIAIANSSPYNQVKIWVHDTIRHAAKLTGSYELRTLPKKESFKLFERNYEISVRSFREGNLPENFDIPKAIEDNSQRKSTPQVAGEALSKMKNILNGG